MLLGLLLGRLRAHPRNVRASWATGRASLLHPGFDFKPATANSAASAISVMFMSMQGFGSRMGSPWALPASDTAPSAQLLSTAL